MSQQPNVDNVHSHMSIRPPSRQRSDLAGFAGWVLLCYGAAAIGAIASIDAGAFYLALERPQWAPPAGVFGPVWSVLYGLMGISAWLVWRQRIIRRRATTLALRLFVVQLVLNALWSWIFFRWHHGALAAAEVALLWLVLAATVFAFLRVRPLAAALMMPYLLWVTFATALTLRVWQLNPGLL